MAEERVYRNKKYWTQGGLFAIGAWMVFYMAPGMVLGLFVSDWAGLAWMVFGAAFS